MKFLKNGELELKNGGYLVAGKEETPVNHEEFVQLQKEAHYLVNLANSVRATNFEVKEAITFDDVVKQVTLKLNDEKRTYVNVPEAEKTPTLDKLQKEALAWLGNKDGERKAEKLNRILQKFNILAEFSEFGLYFSTDKIVKLQALYSLEQVVEAVTTLEPHINE
jgi:hypothetical protein